MAILEKKVIVGLNHMNISYYEELGYEIPRKDKNGKMIVKVGTKILVDINDLQKMSQVKVTKICDECNMISLNQPYYVILTAREGGDGKDRCKKCGKKSGAITQKNNVKYEKSLEYLAKKNRKEYLLKEFSNKNKKSPSKISYGTRDEFI